jgi:DNA polymerase-3 subunit epsilon
MEPEVRAAQLDQAYRFISENQAPTPSSLIGTRILELKVRDKRQVRRAVRRLLSNDSRFQEVHAGLWETIGWDYAEMALEQAPFRVLDLEVTGSDPEHNAIIDLAVFEVQGDAVQPLLSTLVDPAMPIPPSIVRLTGIDDRMVHGQPRFEDLLPDLVRILEGGVFVAHNASFDYRFLKTHIERATGQRFTAPHVCTVKLSQRLIEPKHGSRKLHHLAGDLGIPLEHRHRAHDDAYATARILQELLRLLRERGILTVGDMKIYESGGPTPQADAV